MLFGRLAAYRRAERVQLRVDRYAPGEADCSGALGVLQGAQPVLAARSSAVADSAAVSVDLPTAAGPRDLRALLRADSFLGVRCLVVPFDPAVVATGLAGGAIFTAVCCRDAEDSVCFICALDRGFPPLPLIAS